MTDLPRDPEAVRLDRARPWLACAEIGQLTDVVTGSDWHDRAVVITIRLDAVDPPAGRVCLTGRPEVSFVGWLGLLRVLSELLEASDP
jgi:hypothetical protein